MFALLEFIEDTAIATWVRESPSIFAYTLVLSLHAIGLSIVVGISSMVALRTLGWFAQIPLRPMVNLFPLMFVGFWINAISGLLLLSANATGMFTMTMFYIKMVFVIAAMVTVRRFRPRLASGASEADLKGLAWAILGLWLFAIIAGRLTAYPYFVESWIGI